MSCFSGDRIGPYRLTLWVVVLRLYGVRDNTAGLARVGWVVL
jgi:hypothetical protein